MSLTLSVPEAAAYLGVSERTVWRHIRLGRLEVVRGAGRVRVLVARRGSVQRVGETGAGYRVEDASGFTPASEPWPFTPENVARHRERLRARRTAAFKELQAISRSVRPDPGGLTAADYLDDVRGPGGGRTDDAG